MILDWSPGSDPLVDLAGGVENSTFSEHGHVAYQIKGNHKWSNMVANIWPTDPSPALGSIGQHLTFLEHGHAA